VKPVGSPPTYSPRRLLIIVNWSVNGSPASIESGNLVESTCSEWPHCHMLLLANNVEQAYIDSEHRDGHGLGPSIGRVGFSDTDGLGPATV